MSGRGRVFALLILGLACTAAAREDYVVLHQKTGPIGTNAYLLYDVASGEAALFDVGGPVESLASAIDEKKLSLKYIFNTHAHVDHVQGVPAIRARYPGAKWCLSRQEFEDIRQYAEFESNLSPDEAAKMKKQMEENKELAAMMTFDFSRLGKPDIFLEDGQVYRLGGLEIRTFLSPGHSRGSICFHAGEVLFSGDVLFYRTVGRPDLPGSGGFQAIASSVRRLYASLPDDTKVYPGHGTFTDIGSEKTQNKYVTFP